MMNFELKFTPPRVVELLLQAGAEHGFRTKDKIGKTWSINLQIRACKLHTS